MASFLSFLGDAISSIFGGSGNTGAYFTLSCNGQSVDFPISPSSFEVSNPFNNSTININAIGDINMIGKRGLKTLSFSSFFPNQTYGWEQVAPTQEPYTYISMLEEFANSGQPCSLSISSTTVNLTCTIEDFKYSEKDGTGDVYFSISLKEYRYVMPASSLITNEASGLKSRVAEAPGIKQTTAIAGHDAMDVAAKSVQKTMSIVKQQKKKLDLYKSIVKSGGFTPGAVVTTLKHEIKLDGKVLERM